LVLGSKTKGKSSGKHQFQWWDVPWIHFSETTSENRDRNLAIFFFFFSFWCRQYQFSCTILSNRCHPCRFHSKHQFQWWDVPWIHFSETTSENRDRRL
jgi:hypothetical protein